MNYYFEAFKKYAIFSGRASRKEYWMFLLYYFIIALVADFVTAFLFLAKLSLLGELMYALIVIWALVSIIPSLSLMVRRLHDTNRSGWWFFISLIPLIGCIWLLVLLVLDSTPGDNKYGPNPKLT